MCFLFSYKPHNRIFSLTVFTRSFLNHPNVIANNTLFTISYDGTLKYSLKADDDCKETPRILSDQTTILFAFRFSPSPHSMENRIAASEKTRFTVPGNA